MKVCSLEHCPWTAETTYGHQQSENSIPGFLMPAYFVGYSSPQVLPVACGTKMFTLLGGFVVLCVYEYIQTYIHTLKKYSVINGAQ